MNENERNITDRDLDEALKLMAEEVPPMPADFHDKWVNAVRKDAEEAKAEPVPAEKAPGRLAYINRFNRILSVAAVFVFLIAGVMLYRASRKEAAMVQDRKQETAAASAAPETAETEDELQVNEAAGFAASQTAAGAAIPEPEAEDMAPGMTADLAEERMDEEADGAAEAAGVKNAAPVFAAVNSAKEAAEPVEEAAYADTMEEAEAFEEADAAEAPLYTPMPTEPPRSGGWTLWTPETAKLPADARAAFDRAAEQAPDVTCRPVALLALQPGADGTSYLILCGMTPEDPSAQPYYALVVIRTDPGGNAEIIRTTEIDPDGMQ